MEYIGHFIVGVVFLFSNLGFGWIAGVLGHRFKKKVGTKGLHLWTAMERTNPLVGLVTAIVGLAFIVPGIVGWEVILYGYYGSWRAAPSSLVTPPIALIVPVAFSLAGVFLYGLWAVYWVE